MTTSPQLSTAGIRQSVMDIVRVVLEQDDIDPSVDLFDQGVPSLAFVRLVARLNEKYDVTLDVTTLEDVTIDALAAMVGAELQKDDYRDGGASR